MGISKVKVRIAFDMDITLPTNSGEDVVSARKYAIAEAMQRFHRLLGDNPNKIYAESKYLPIETWAGRNQNTGSVKTEVAETISPLEGVNPPVS